MSLTVAALALMLSSHTQPALVLGETPASDCLAAARSTIVMPDDVEACEHAIENLRLPRTDRAASLVNYGIVLRKRGRSVDAVAAYDRAVALTPDLAEAYLNRSAALVELGRTEAALADIEQALALGPLMPHVAYYNRSLIYELQDELALAYRDLQQAVALQPDYTPALTALERYQVVRAGG